MLTELEIVVFLKSNEDLTHVADRVFAALHTPYQVATSDEWGGEHYTAEGLGFQAVLYRNAGDVQDPEFEGYQFALDLQSSYWCVDLDALNLDAGLSEYYARLLAFALNAETATEIFLEATEEVEIFEIRSYRRNPQYRRDQAPTTPRVFVVETRQVEEMFEDEEDVDDIESEEWEEAEEEERL